MGLGALLIRWPIIKGRVVVKAIFTTVYIILKATQNGYINPKVTFQAIPELVPGLVQNTKLALFRVMRWTESLISAR